MPTSLLNNCCDATHAGFGQLRSLVKLQASFNAFTLLPDDMWQLPELELFRLAVCHLQEWPARLAEAGAQRRLHLRTRSAVCCVCVRVCVCTTFLGHWVPWSTDGVLGWSCLLTNEPGRIASFVFCLRQTV